MLQTLYHVSEYKEELLYPAICKAMDALSIANDLRSGLKVVIKPNLVMAKSPDFPVTTHPLVVKAVVHYLCEHGVTDITLAESSGGLYNTEHMKNLYRVCGMSALGPDIRMNMDFTAQTIPTRDGFKNHSFHLITPIVEADYIINICKLKTHSMTGYSGGIKNLFGTIPGLEKPQMHYRWPGIEDFSNMLLELAQTVAPQLTIIDAVDAMEGNGPTGGTSHPLKMILAARDFYTQDYFAAGLMKLDPMSIVMIRQAVEQGLAHPEEIQLVGDAVPQDLTPFQVPDTRKLDFSTYVPGFLRKPAVFIMKRVLKSYPLLNKNKCVGCGKCAESCPTHIIRIKGDRSGKKKAVFQKKGCISCFCCQEMCPMKAIEVRKAL